MSALKLVKDVLNYGLGQVLPRVIGFLLIPLYTAYLSPADFGVFDLAIALSAFLLVVMRLSVPGAITRFYFEYKGPSEKIYISSIYWTVTGLSVISSVIFLIVAFFFIDTLLPGLPFYPIVVLVVIAAFLNSSSDIQKRLLQVRQQSADSARLSIFTALVTILLSIMFVVVFDMNAIGLVLATAIASFLLFIQAQFYLRKDIGWQFSLPLAKESVQFSLVLFPYHVYGHLSTLVTKSILSAYATLSAVGILAIGTKFTQPFTIIINAFGAAFTPQYLAIRSTKDHPDFEKLSMLIKRIWFACTFLFLTFYLFIDVIILFMTSQAYASSVPVTKILSLGFLPQMFYIIFSNELLFRKENKKLLLINMIGISLSLLMSWILVRLYLAEGAAIAIVAPSFVGALLIYIFTRKKIEFTPPWKFITLSSMTCLAVVVGERWLNFWPDPWAGMLVRLVLVFTLCAICLRSEPALFEVIFKFVKKIKGTDNAGNRKD